MAAKKKSAKDIANGIVGLFLLAGIAWGAIATTTGGESAAPTAAETAACREDVDCAVQPIRVDAFAGCRLALEAALGGKDYEWTSGVTSPRFPAWAWGDKVKGIAAFMGDQIKISGQRHAYKCQFDIAAKEVVEVTAWPGRI